MESRSSTAAARTSESEWARHPYHGVRRGLPDTFVSLALAHYQSQAITHNHTHKHTLSHHTSPNSFPSRYFVFYVGRLSLRQHHTEQLPATIDELHHVEESKADDTILMVVVGCSSASLLTTATRAHCSWVRPYRVHLLRCFSLEEPLSIV